jgi:hypothetical protein
MGVKTLQAAKQVQLTSDRPELRQQMSNVAMLNSLVDMSRTYSAIPAFSQTDGQGRALPDFFLHTLYNARTVADISQGAAQLDAFLREPSNPGRPIFGENAANRLRLMQFMSTLLKTVVQVPALNTSGVSVPAIQQLAELGRLYASLDPSTATNHPDPKLFLNTLWQSSDIQKATTELSASLTDWLPANKLDVLELQIKLLATLKMLPDPDLQARLNDTSYLNAMLDWIAKHEESKSNEDLVVDDLNGFFPAVANSTYERGVIVASSELNQFASGLPPWTWLEWTLDPIDGAGSRLRYARLSELYDASPYKNEYTRIYISLILQEAFKQRVSHRGKVAFILAIASHESIFSSDLTEGISNYCPTYSGGCMYRGRGFIHLTNKENYDDYTSRRLTLNRTQLDFTNNPDLAARADIAAFVIVDYLVQGRITRTAISINDPSLKWNGSEEAIEAAAIALVNNYPALPDGEQRLDEIVSFSQAYLQVLKRFK